MTNLSFGDICRARCTAPARYLGNGKCLFVSAMCNELCIDDAASPTGEESNFPLPTDDELRAALEGNK